MKPNVVLVVLDSVRWDHLSCYGYGRRTTPRIDAIAAEGSRYRSAYAASCWTLPSHASLFTGLYPSAHRADMDTQRLAPEHDTLAACLGRAGYRTACFSCNGFVSERTGLTRGFDTAVDVGRLRGGTGSGWARMVRGAHRRWRERVQPDRGAHRATRLARRWLHEHGRAAPFFLFLNYMECHLPYRLRGRDRRRFIAPADRNRAGGAPPDAFACMAAGRVPAAEELDRTIALYDGALHYLDRQVGALDDALRDVGVRDRTLLIITSDHGESFGERGLLDHQFHLGEHLIRVPLVLRLPRAVPAGAAPERLVHHVDLAATIADLAGAARPPGRGASILSATEREEAFAEYLVPNLRPFRRRFPHADVRRFDVALRAVRTRPLKLIETSDGRAELFDLDSDPAESADLAADRSADVDRLRARIAAALGPWPADRAGGSEPAAMAEVRDRLEALGYL